MQTMEFQWGGMRYSRIPWVSLSSHCESMVCHRFTISHGRTMVIP